MMNASSRRRFPVQLPSSKPATVVAKTASLDSGLGLDSCAVRQAMIRRLAKDPQLSPLVLQVMGQVERHRFVETALVHQAYEDTSLPIGFSQTISKPSVIARMISLLLHQRPHLGRVLEIGTGCGYQAAVLSGLSSYVLSIERIKGLHEKARAHIRGLGLSHLHLVLGDGMLGYPEKAPYDSLISAAAGAHFPSIWLDQLAMGGVAIAPTEVKSGQQALVMIEKTPSGNIERIFETVRFVPLQSGTL